jgi:hypothetical protein
MSEFKIKAGMRRLNVYLYFFFCSFQAFPLLFFFFIFHIMNRLLNLLVVSFILFAVVSCQLDDPVEQVIEMKERKEGLSFIILTLLLHSWSMRILHLWIHLSMN